MAKGLAFIALCAVLALAGSGCSYRAWYQGLQDRQRLECYLLQGEAEVQRCLERVNAMSYDDYARQRQQRREGPP